MPWWGWRRRGWKWGFGRGYGWMRWQVAMLYGDPDRAMFGLGPCGEMAYQEYKKGNIPSTYRPIQTETQQNTIDEKTQLENEIKYLEQRLEELRKLYQEKYGKQ